MKIIPFLLIWLLTFEACKSEQPFHVDRKQDNHNTQMIYDTVYSYLLKAKGVAPCEVIHADSIEVDTLLNGQQVIFRIQDGSEITTRHDKNQTRYYAWRELYVRKLGNHILNAILDRKTIMDQVYGIDLRYFNLMHVDLLKEENERLYMRLQFAIPETSIAIPIVVSISSTGLFIVHQEY